MYLDDLAGKRFLITSGPTRCYIDAVRFISNKSTGNLGAIVATEALKRGASITFIYGVGSTIPDVTLLDKVDMRRINLIEIETIDDLLTIIQIKLRERLFDVIIHAMAVVDYSPEAYIDGKIASNKEKLQVTFSRTPKVIKLIRNQWPNAFLAGFKLEVNLTKDELIERAHISMLECGSDIIVANNINEILEEKHKAYIINLHKEIESVCETKQEVSKNLIDIISKRLEHTKK